MLVENVFIKEAKKQPFLNGCVSNKGNSDGFSRNIKMRKTIILSGLLIVFGGASSGVITAQTSVPTNPTTATEAKQKLELATGEVSTIGGGKIVLQTKDGARIEIVLSDKTEYKRLSPENPSLKTATAANLSDIGVGDKVAITGMFAADRKTMPARAIFLMTKSDISQKQNKEREEWRTRGISGQVAAVNPQTKEITVSSRSFAGERKTVLTAKDNADIRRYAADSVDYNEAKTSSLGEIKVGDSIRALGERSEDGATLKAEKIVTGAFQTLGGTITAIDTAKNEITINNIQTKKPLTIALGKNTILKQIPAETAQRIAQFQAMQAGGGVLPGQGANRPAQPNSNAGGQPNAGQGQNPNRTWQGGGNGGAGGMRGGNIDDMLERFPTISIGDLKVGDMIAVSSTKNQNVAAVERVNAIKLLSGVEPFLKAAQQTAVMGGGQRGGQNTILQIPGLDSNFP